jgi:hypothetical protein
MIPFVFSRQGMWIGQVNVVSSTEYLLVFVLSLDEPRLAPATTSCAQIKFENIAGGLLRSVLPGASVGVCCEVVNECIRFPFRCCYCYVPLFLTYIIIY